MEPRRSTGPHRDAGGDDRIELSGEEARQGRIVLNTRPRRVIFIGGLVLFVIIAVAAGTLFY